MWSKARIERRCPPPMFPTMRSVATPFPTFYSICTEEHTWVLATPSKNKWCLQTTKYSILTQDQFQYTRHDTPYAPLPKGNGYTQGYYTEI